mgnify:FL=1
MGKKFLIMNVSEKIKSGIGINVLSLFDEISCRMVALERANIPVCRYNAYEIEL